MHKADRLSGLFWLLFSLFASFEAYKLGLGSLNQPGPGFFFFWTGIVTSLLSLIVIARSVGRRVQAERVDPGEGKLLGAKFLLVLPSLLLYAFLFERLGFLILTFLLFIFLLGVVERKSWWLTVSASILVTALAYVIFEVTLQSQLPAGLLEFIRY